MRLSEKWVTGGSCRSAVMASGRVVRLAREHLPSLAARLTSYGARSVQTRSILLQLERYLTRTPFQALTSSAADGDLVSVTVLRPTPGFAVMDVCAPESSTGRRNLELLMRSADLKDLWSGPFRVEGVAEDLVPVITSAASERGMRRLIYDGDIQRLFTPRELENGRPEFAEKASPRSPEDFVLRPLQREHLARVRAKWAFSELCPDMDFILTESLRAGLTLGAFQAGASPAEERPGPVSWALVTPYGAHGLGFTEKEFRSRGVSKMVLEGLARRTRSLGLPVFNHAVESNVASMHIVKNFGFVPQYVALWLQFVPDQQST